jgi:hypothetical protein
MTRPDRPAVRTVPNLLADPAAVADDGRDFGPARITRYGADVLGRALGHAIADDGDGPDPWRDYGRLLWPAVASSPVMPPFARLVDAASEVLDR